jgi:hypothetical protein
MPPVLQRISFPLPVQPQSSDTRLAPYPKVAILKTLPPYPDAKSDAKWHWRKLGHSVAAGTPGLGFVPHFVMRQPRLLP